MPKRSELLSRIRLPEGGIPDQLEAIKHALVAKELAYLFQTTPGNVYKLAKKAIIPCFHIGGSVRFDPHAVAQWMREAA